MSNNTNQPGEQITLEEAIEMTSAYREENPDETKAHFFGKEILEQILNQDGCEGIRMYYGIDSDGEKQLVLVGVTEEGLDLKELCVDRSYPCPEYCDSTSPLCDN